MSKGVLIVRHRTDFGENLRKTLRKKGIRNIQFAEMMNVRRTTVDQWLYYGAEPKFDSIVKMCVLLGITPNDLFTKGDIKWKEQPTV